MSGSPHSLVVFSIDERQFALDIAAVKSVHRSVEISLLPESPPGVRGVINVRGAILPVFDLRAKLGFPLREVRASDHLIIAHTTWRTVVMLVDSVGGVVACDPVALTSARTILPGLKSVADAMTIGGEIILVHDVDSFLSLEERDALQLTLKI